METDTAYSYLLNSLNKPCLFDIRAISSDFMSRLSSEQVEELNNAVLGTQSQRASKPKNDAQMNALIHSEVINSAHWFEPILLDLDRDVISADDCVIVDYDCGIGLSSIAMIHCFREWSLDGRIKEVILIEEDETCLSRAELLVSAMLPSSIVKAINKAAKNITADDVKSEHIMTYNLICGRYSSIDEKTLDLVLHNSGYLFSKTILKSSSVDYSAKDYCSFHISEEFDTKTDKLGNSLIVKVNLSNILNSNKNDSRDYFDRFACAENILSLNDPYSKNYDSHVEELQNFIKNRDSSAKSSYDYFESISDTSPLAKLNVAECLYYGIGCEVDKESSISILKSLEKTSDADFRAFVLERLALLLDDNEKRISIWEKVTDLNIVENEKCKSRCNIACTLGKSSVQNYEIEELYRKCIEFGCRNCREVHKYNTQKCSCPKAQYMLSIILGCKKDFENSILLLKESASQGYKPALKRLGKFYASGICVEKNLDMSVALWKEAALSGDTEAQINLFKLDKKEKPATALWYLAAASNEKDVEAQELMLDFLPKVISGELLEQQKEFWIIALASEGIKKYQDKAIHILVNRGDVLMRDLEVEEARKTFEKIRQFDSDLAEKKLRELDYNTPVSYYHNDIYADNYSYSDSLSDALDDVPGAYWNID